MRDGGEVSCSTLGLWDGRRFCRFMATEAKYGHLRIQTFSARSFLSKQTVHFTSCGFSVIVMIAIICLNRAREKRIKASNL